MSADRGSDLEARFDQLEAYLEERFQELNRALGMSTALLLGAIEESRAEINLNQQNRSMDRALHGG